MNYLHLIGSLILGMIFYHILKGFCGCRVEGFDLSDFVICESKPSYLKNNLNVSKDTNDTFCKKYGMIECKNNDGRCQIF